MWEYLKFLMEIVREKVEIGYEKLYNNYLNIRFEHKLQRNFKGIEERCCLDF